MRWSKPTPNPTSSYPGKKASPPSKPGLLRRLASGALSGAKKVGRATASTIRYVAPHAKKSARYVGRGVARGGRFVGHEVKKEVKAATRRKIKRAVRYVSGESTGEQTNRSSRFDRYGNPRIRRSHGRRP